MILPVLIFSAALKGELPDQVFRLSKGLEVSTEDCRQGYSIVDEGASVLFLFYPPLFEQDNIKMVQVAGTFTRWKELPEWVLKKQGRSGLWTLKVPIEKVEIPGNSGQPEFKFVVSTGKPAGTWLSSKSPWQLGANNLILLPGDDTNELRANIELALTLKRPTDFDLNNPVDEAMLANFRQAPGTQNLYRSYHPYKISRALNKTEPMRIEAVKRLMLKYSIHSVICLSGNEKAFANANENISDYQQKIIDNKHELFENANYNLVYYESTSREMGLMVQRVVQFILDEKNSGPFLVHCRLGTDRTGVMVGILSGLCGSPWKDIRQDYQKSNNMGMKEFRDYKLLRYALEQMIGEKLTDGTDLQAGLSQYFIKNGYLSREQIDALGQKLK